MARRFCTVDGCVGVRTGFGLCSKHYQARRYATEPKVKAYHATRYVEKKDAILARNAIWRNGNIEKIKAHRKTTKDQALLRSRKWAKANPEKKKAGAIKWARNHPDQAARRRVLRRTTERQATPMWANAAKIREKYLLAARLTESTGIVWHVDHSVPLINELVCGLHVEHNLQVIPAAINMKKSNRWWPDMPTDLESRSPVLAHGAFGLR